MIKESGRFIKGSISDGSFPEIDEFRAYALPGLPAMHMIPAPGVREWMKEVPSARLCLPLRVASQHGWELLNPHAFVATWNGGLEVSSLELRYLEGSPPYAVRNRLGGGIVTWRIPYLFRTPPGIGILCRGPANHPVDGASPLEALIETEWTEGVPSLNWKITRVGEPIYFAEGQPIGMIVPIDMRLAESLRPGIHSLDEDPELSARVDVFLARKHLSAEASLRREKSSVGGGMYFEGRDVWGEPAESHRRELNLREFRRGR